MKKYTLKYIPVEGEIGMGDHYLLFMHGLKSSKRRREETGEQFVIIPRWNLHHFTGKQSDKLALLTNPSDRKRVKLYLISRDFKIGDVVTLPTGKEVTIHDTTCIEANKFLGSYRNLGEVSPIPLGIKLDQEVTDGQVRFLVAPDASQPNAFMEFNERTFLEHPEFPRKIEIKMGV